VLTKSNGRRNASLGAKAAIILRRCGPTKKQLGEKVFSASSREKSVAKATLNQKGLYSGG
jgi:hypothetical protein